MQKGSPQGALLGFMPWQRAPLAQLRRNGPRPYAA